MALVICKCGRTESEIVLKQNGMRCAKCGAPTPVVTLERLGLETVPPAPPLPDDIAEELKGDHRRKPKVHHHDHQADD